MRHCLYRVWQFLNEARKVCYGETQRNGTNMFRLFLGKLFENFRAFLILDGKLSTGWPVA